MFQFETSVKMMLRTKCRAVAPACRKVHRAEHHPAAAELHTPKQRAETLSGGGFQQVVLHTSGTEPVRILRSPTTHLGLANRVRRGSGQFTATQRPSVDGEVAPSNAIGGSRGEYSLFREWCLLGILPALTAVNIQIVVAAQKRWSTASNPCESERSVRTEPASNCRHCPSAGVSRETFPNEFFVMFHVKHRCFY